MTAENVIDPNKAQVVFEYLHREFPDCLLAHSFDEERQVQTFSIVWAHRFFLLRISRNLFESTEREIGIALQKRNVAAALRQSATGHALLTAGGIIEIPG